MECCNSVILFRLGPHATETSASPLNIQKCVDLWKQNLQGWNPRCVFCNSSEGDADEIHTQWRPPPYLRSCQPPHFRSLLEPQETGQRNWWWQLRTCRVGVAPWRSLHTHTPHHAAPPSPSPRPFHQTQAASREVQRPGDTLVTPIHSHPWIIQGFLFQLQSLPCTLTQGNQKIWKSWRI